MELSIFGVNVLLLIFVWRYMLRKTILDHTRDKLFDLRDEVRATFVKNGWDLNSPIYKRLRDLLNGHLRFTEEFSIWKIAFLETELKRRADLKAELHTRVQNVFATDNVAQKEFILSVRRRALCAVMDFAVFSSGFLLVLSLFIAPIIVLAKIIQVLRGGLGAGVSLCKRSFYNGSKLTSKIMSSAAGFISRCLFVPDLFESYSYRIGTA